MSDCCQALAEPQRHRSRLLCRQCGSEGQPVDRTTIEALLKPESLSEVNGSQYMFCETPNCPVVYYAADGMQFKKEHVRVRVGLKETEDPVPVCYCFGVTERMIDEEVQQTGRSSASIRIRAEVKAGHCRCEVENPSGQCCLGDAIRVESVRLPSAQGAIMPSHVREERRSKMRPSVKTLERIGPIEPLETEAATQFLSLAKSLLGWDSAQLDQKAETVWKYVLTQYPTLGRAPTRQELITALQGGSVDEIQAALARLHELDMLCLDSESQEIRVAYPFSSVPTRHLVRFPGWDDAAPVYAQCAIDALGIPFMLRRDVAIASSCMHCAESLTIEIESGAIVTADPPTTVVWAGTTWTGHAADSVCPTINFFCSPDHAIAWQQQPEAAGQVLSLGEALCVGKGIFEDLLRPNPDATISSSPTAAPPSKTAKAAITAGTAGGLLAAFLASLCCIGPVVFAALGVGIGATGFLAGTAGNLKTLLPYRPWFIGLTLLLLGMSFYYAYRKPSSTCATETGCAARSASGLNRKWLWLIAALALLLVLAPYWLAL